ncbi:MAG TPA: sulfotransferase domain-containing protein, partial [Dongiaceae bacterium]
HLQNMRKDHPDSTLVIRYEDLVLHPHACLKEILEFCEIEAVSDAVGRCLAEAPDVGDFQKTHATSSSARSSIGRWRQDLPPAALDCYETQLKSVNAALGYD